jgi:propanol-preferring alcohol dehydrogenase
MKVQTSTSYFARAPFLLSSPYSPHLQEVRTVPVPTPGPDDVLIKLNATGLCMSDIHYMLNDWNLPKMSAFGTQCAGHEGAGVIVKVGERVKGLKVGMRAGFKPIVDVCHACEMCRAGRETYCQGVILAGLQVDGECVDFS